MEYDFWFWLVELVQSNQNILSSWLLRFDIIPLITNFGTGVALLGGATIITDFLLVYVLPKKKFYKNWKFEVEEDTTMSLPVADGNGLHLPDILEKNPLLSKQQNVNK